MYIVQLPEQDELPNKCSRLFALKFNNFYFKTIIKIINIS